MRARLLIFLLVLASACGAPDVVPDYPKTDGQRHALPGAPYASIVVPKDYEAIAPLTWALRTNDGPVLLTVRRQQEPPDGMHAELDRQIKQLRQGGEADLAADRVVQVGDLEGRLIEATTLRNVDPPTSLWLLLCVAEDGMYGVTVAGPTAALQDHRKELSAFLESLRVALPPPHPATQPAGAPPVPDLVLPDGDAPDATPDTPPPRAP